MSTYTLQAPLYTHLSDHNTWRKKVVTLLSLVKPLPYKRENEQVVLIILDRNLKSKVQDRPLCVLSLPATMLVGHSGLPEFIWGRKGIGNFSKPSWLALILENSLFLKPRMPQDKCRATQIEEHFPLANLPTHLIFYRQRAKLSKHSSC